MAVRIIIEVRKRLSVIVYTFKMTASRFKVMNIRVIRGEEKSEKSDWFWSEAVHKTQVMSGG